MNALNRTPLDRSALDHDDASGLECFHVAQARRATRYRHLPPALTVDLAGLHAWA